MQKRTLRHLGAIAFAGAPWAIWYLWGWRWSGQPLHYRLPMNEHLVMLLTLLFGAGCGIFALAWVIAKPRGLDTAVLGTIVLVLVVWYWIDIGPLIYGGFLTRWTRGV